MGRWIRAGEGQRLLADAAAIAFLRPRPDSGALCHAAQLDAVRPAGRQTSRGPNRLEPLGLQTSNPRERERAELARVALGEIHRSNLSASAAITLPPVGASGS